MRPYKYREIVKIIESHGARFARKGKGSHMIFKREGRTAVVPKHGKSIPPRTVKDILNNLEIVA